VKRPTSDLSQTARLLRVVTHPTQVIQRRDVRAGERPSAASDRLSGILLVSAAVGASSGLVLAVTGILIRVPSMFLLGAILVAGGMAAASLEGLLEPETELIARIRRIVNR
jgi:hypothetical protein